jgi:uncharacterized membrane protein YphA (DoxX/SURF4 family)
VKYSLSRYIYGLAAVGFGLCALVWHDISNWPQLKTLAEAPREVVIHTVAAIEILGGIAVLSPKTAGAGAAALGAIYVVFALLGIRSIVEHPLVYNGFGNFFEQFSLAAGAMILYATYGAIASGRRARLAQIGYYSFGICLLSFALEQYFYLSATAGLVPKWIPPGQMFWAIATTAAFALAAAALLTGFMARLASRLTTAMLVGFGLLVWFPAILAGPHSLPNWSEGVETLAIAGSAWIVADFLDQNHADPRRIARTNQ